jgi:hypothetical protein
VTQADFCKFVQTLGIFDSNFNFETAERVFIACKAPPAPDPKFQLSDRDMNRYEFLESLVRIADLKYIAPKVMDDYPEALH